jgi:hypothetical protein
MYDDSVYLVPPVHRVKSQYDYRDIMVVILNDSEELYRNNCCDIREIIGGYQVNVDKIEIAKPLGKLKYRLMAGDEIIYDSRDKLYRNYVAFNNDGHELNNNMDFEGTIYVAYREGEANLNDISLKEHYCIGYKLVRLGDTIEIGHEVFNCSSMAKPGTFGQTYNNCYVQCEEQEKLMPVYNGTCYVVFEAENISNKFEIDINEKPHKLSEMQYKATEKVGSTKYVVELDIQEPGVYSVEVNQLVAGNKNRILHDDFAYDTELIYDKKLIDRFTYRVQITSKLLSCDINTEIAIDDFMPSFIKFEYCGRNYTYFIPFDFGFYKLSNGGWRSPADDIWIDDINDKSVLTLYDSECDGLLLYTESGVLAEKDIKLIDKGFYKQLSVYFLTSFKGIYSYTTLAFTANGKVKYAVPCYNKCVMDEEKTEIVCYDNPKKITITPMFHGKNKVFYEMFNSKGEKILTSTLLESGQTSSLTNFMSFQKYTIRFYEKTKGLQLKKISLLLEEQKTFYAKEDFTGKSFRIAEAYFNQMKCGRFVETQWYFSKYFVKLTDVLDADRGIFEGQIYSKSYKGNFFLYKINPVDVELCSDVIDGTMDIYMTNQGDGLLFDPEYRGIMNSMEHPTAPDIFLYTINLKEEDE